MFDIHQRPLKPLNLSCSRPPPPVTRRMDIASTARPQLKLRRIHLDTGR
jgi:hypothetical protein